MLKRYLSYCVEGFVTLDRIVVVSRILVVVATGPRV